MPRGASLPAASVAVCLLQLLSVSLWADPLHQQRAEAAAVRHWAPWWCRAQFLAVHGARRWPLPPLPSIPYLFVLNPEPTHPNPHTLPQVGCSVAITVIVAEKMWVSVPSWSGGSVRGAWETFESFWTTGGNNVCLLTTKSVNLCAYSYVVCGVSWVLNLIILPAQVTLWGCWGVGGRAGRGIDENGIEGRRSARSPPQTGAQQPPSATVPAPAPPA